MLEPFCGRVLMGRLDNPVRDTAHISVVPGMARKATISSRANTTYKERCDFSAGLSRLVFHLFELLYFPLLSVSQAL